MLSKINPYEIIASHYRSMYRHDTGKIDIIEVGLHFSIPLSLAIVAAYCTEALTSEVVGIIVSAASIVAGLMLNLLVLVYTLAYNTKNSGKPISKPGEFKTLTDELLATISYSILICIGLVATAFLALAKNLPIAEVGKFVTIFLGASAMLCLLMVLKRCHILVAFELNQC
ncbi:MAG: hypothetical protein HY836_08575 [Aquabacterium sp.]|uniref:hypothetical protein n=1 Tax=Aquabacterium sp. TaxID=1872578 RepID=UPI0025C6EA02|nr:hypothetical protein [Aquabacterium sp.]MBI5925644.1 hypothetical protein [Aquabacterium sp.]